jgi:hypothetical protein
VNIGRGPSCVQASCRRKYIVFPRNAQLSFDYTADPLAASTVHPLRAEEPELGLAGCESNPRPNSDAKSSSLAVGAGLCKAPMKLDVYIAPIGKTEGMNVYSCPRCDRTESNFIPPASRVPRSTGS